MGYIRRRSVGAVLLAVAVAAGASGCSGSSSGSESGSHLGVSAFASEMGKPGAVVLDVRTPSEFAGGHLAGAKNIDVESGDFDSDIASMDKNASYAVYCRSGRRSGIALDKMTSAGFKHVVDLSGGVTAWTSEGRQLTTG
jgi:rhodanese-related sulfurtransferase